MNAALDFKIIPSFSMTWSTFPLTYASTSTGIGASLTTTLPVLLEIDSIVPFTGLSTAVSYTHLTLPTKRIV